MSEAHSKGPWKIGGEYGPTMDEIVDAEGRTVAAVWTRKSKSAMRAPITRRDSEPHPVWTANANLIAVAPEMLAVLERCANYFDEQDDQLLVDAVEKVILKAKRAS